MAAKSKKNSEEVTEAIVKEAPAALAPETNYGKFGTQVQAQTRDDMIIQRYRCVQNTTKSKDELGLKVGEFYGSLTKKGMKRALVVPIYEERKIVERTNDLKGQFLGILPLAGQGDARVDAAYRANRNSYVKLTCPKNGTKLVETRDVHVAFLDEEDGVTVIDYGVLQFDSTNLTPATLWKDSYRKSRGGRDCAAYFFRTIVETETHKNKDGQESKKFKLTPYKGDWLAGKLRQDIPEELALLEACYEQYDLIQSGALKIEYSDADDSAEARESAAEEAAF